MCVIRLKGNERILARVSELLEHAAERAEITVASLIAGAEEARKLAMAAHAVGCWHFDIAVVQLPNSRNRLRTIASNTGLGSVIEPLIEARIFQGRSLLLQGLVALACQQRNLCFLAGGRGTATAYGLWPIAALCRCRPAASRFNCFVACAGAPSHWLALGLGQGNLAHRNSPGYE